ncbi:hypothetical protein ONZ45_g15975 [Pleurotus djamor]|nr:hypothetical protein ONZ45_g15975 [Pleurotus djamor]
MYPLAVVALPLITAPSALAAQFPVVVGVGGFTFNPPSITAQAGDTVLFQFFSGNHSLARSTFAQPCVERVPVFESGFISISGSGGRSTWSFTVDSDEPIWFFCRQTVPENHCERGMVFAINAPPEQSFEAFRAAAMGIGPASGTSPWPEATTPPAESAATSPPAANPSATSPSATSVEPVQGSSSATSEAAPAASSSDAAVPVKRGAGLLVGAGLAACLLL